MQHGVAWAGTLRQLYWLLHGVSRCSHLLTLPYLWCCLSSSPGTGHSLCQRGAPGVSRPTILWLLLSASSVLLSGRRAAEAVGGNTVWATYRPCCAKPAHCTLRDRVSSPACHARESFALTARKRHYSAVWAPLAHTPACCRASRRPTGQLLLSGGWHTACGCMPRQLDLRPELLAATQR